MSGLRQRENARAMYPVIIELLKREKFSENDLQDEFEENDSEIETVARESIAVSVEYVLKWFGIEIDIEDAIGARDW